MQKKKVTAIIVLMVFSLGSLIAIQAYWIRHAVALRQQQFKKSVNEALLYVSYKMEQKEVANMMQSNGLLWSGYEQLQNDFNQLVLMNEDVEALSDPNMKQKYPPRDTVALKAPQQDNYPVLQMDVDTTIKIDSAGLRSTINITINDSVHQVDYYFKDARNAKQELNRARKKIASKKEQVDDMFSQFFGFNRDFHERVSDNELCGMLDLELGMRKINIPYEYMVVNALGVPVTYSTPFTQDMVNQSHSTILFPNDLFGETNHLLVYFPDQQRFIISSLGVMSFSSMALILIISLCFAYTIYVIFRQKKLSDMKTDFINNMTHELKTPVATISLASEMMLDPGVQQDHGRVSRFANVIHQENKRLGNQVEKVLQMAVLDRGDFQLRLAVVDVHQTIRELVDKLALRLDDEQGTCKLKLNAQDPTIQADDVHFTNLLMNLLDNAIKYSTSTPDITIATRDTKSGVYISVKDHGIGMSREQMKRVFEKFYRVPTGNLHNVKGFGLGLSYVKVIVDAHGGEITVSSEPGKGSEFVVFMPRKANGHLNLRS